MQCLHNFSFLPLAVIKKISDIRTLESHLDQIKQKHTEARDPIVAQVRKLADSFQSTSETIKSQVTAGIKAQIQTEMQSAFLR